MADAAHEIGSRLAALRARKQRWLTRFAAVEHVQGKSMERAQCKSNLKIVDELIVAAEKKLNAAEHRAAVTENNEIVEEETNMAARTDLDELRKLAAACDTHARGLGTSIKELHSKLTAHRMANNGRGPSGIMITSMLERCSAVYFAGTALRSMRGPLAAQRSFAQTVEAWMPSLSPATPAPPPPPPARKPAPTYERKHAAPSTEGLPRLD